MAVFLTGATGYLGSYLLDRLLRSGSTVTALVRAADGDAARLRLWRSLQLHMPANRLAEHLSMGRLRFVRGDLRAPRLGLEPRSWERLVGEHDAVVHTAATLNRRSARACTDVNLRGGLAVVQLARAIADGPGLRRYLHVSTNAVAGQRQGEVVGEDAAIEWSRSDWDPYARTKKFGEHLVAELLPEESTVIVRPSIVLGDSRFGETTQFDMARAFVFLARSLLLPFDPEARLDIVPADFVADAAAWLVNAEAPQHSIYHLTAGTAAPSFRAIAEAVRPETGRRIRFAPRLGGTTAAAVKALAGLRKPGLLTPVRAGAALLDVFWPYLRWDCVFDNTRVVQETGIRPAAFVDYCRPLLRFCHDGGFTYPYRPLPPIVADVGEGELASAPALSAGGRCG